jgi:hypothetical protein
LLVALTSSLFVLAACERKTADGEAEPSHTQHAAGAHPSTAPEPPATARPAAEEVELPEVRVRPEGETTVRVTWLTPEGTSVNEEAPFRVRWNRSDGLTDAPADMRSTGGTVKDGFELKVRPMPGAPSATLDGEISIVVCDDVTHSVCLPIRRSIELGFVAAKDAAAVASVAIPLPAAH